MSELPLVVLDSIVERALAEDLSAGDVTSEACVDAKARSSARAIAKSDLVTAGSDVAKRVFARQDPAVRFSVVTEDGVRVERGAVLWTVDGPSRSLLAAERTALNLVQRMCGIATMTRECVDAVAPGAKTRIIDTRKTTPGLRVLERYAVRCGGGKNHRDNLGSAVLIKDNHIRAAGGVRTAVTRAKARAPHTSRIECEVTTLAELADALDAGADIVLLDNMSGTMTAEAVRLVAGRAFIEASGGITLERIGELSRLGVDAISVGALTHSIKAADISLEFD
jgi:nicotinate-nucleotide pyrophosphorylase (carboxylating)